MGRTFVTFAEAAQMLKRTVRTVHTYVDKGLIRREYEDGNVVLRREDVEQLVSSQGAGLPPLNNATLIDIQGRLRALETQMAVVRKMNGIEDQEPLRPSPELALGLIGAAREAAKERVLASEEIHMWITQLQRIDEVTFELFNKAGAPPDCWQVFYGLCIHLMEFVSDPKRCKDSRVWYQFHLELTECLKRLRSIVLVWIESGKGSASTPLRQSLGRGNDDLVRRLMSPNGN